MKRLAALIASAGCFYGFMWFCVEQRIWVGVYIGWKTEGVGAASMSYDRYILLGKAMAFW